MIRRLAGYLVRQGMRLLNRMPRLRGWLVQQVSRFPRLRGLIIRLVRGPGSTTTAVRLDSHSPLHSAEHSRDVNRILAEIDQHATARTPLEKP